VNAPPVATALGFQYVDPTGALQSLKDLGRGHNSNANSLSESCIRDSQRSSSPEAPIVCKPHAVELLAAARRRVLGQFLQQPPRHCACPNSISGLALQAGRWRHPRQVAAVPCHLPRRPIERVIPPALKRWANRSLRPPILRNNVGCTICLCNASAAPVREALVRVAAPSSTVYGPAETSPTEDMPLAPLTRRRDQLVTSLLRVTCARPTPR